MLGYAEGNISKARSEANSNLNESHSVYDDSLETLSKAYEARNLSAEFKVSLELSCTGTSRYTGLHCKFLEI